jgi:hypothetical protein
MDAPRRACVRSHAMPLLELSDAELSTAATACRAMAYQEGERARAMSNPDMRRAIENTARRFAQLAARLETARRPSSATDPSAPRPQRRSCYPARTTRAKQLKERRYSVGRRYLSWLAAPPGHKIW